MSIQVLKKIQPRNPNLWEFSFLDAPQQIFLIKNITLPFITLETETRRTGSKHYTKFNAEDEFKITFHENRDFSILRYLEHWMNTVFNKYLKVFNTGIHVKQASLRFINYFPIIGSFVPLALPIKTYLFKDILIKGIDNMDLDYEQTEGQLISATFIAKTVMSAL